MIYYYIIYTVCALMMVAILSYTHVHYETEHLRLKDLAAFIMYGGVWPVVCLVSVLLAIFGMVLLAFDKWDTTKSRVLLYNKGKVAREMQDRILKSGEEKEYYAWPQNKVGKITP
jgi:membrane protein required for beta-lactamase induction